MENDNYKPNRYTRRHPKAVVRPFFAAILRSPFIVQPMMFAVNLPDCRTNPDCLLELREKWKSVTPDNIKAMIADGADVTAWGYSAVCADQSYRFIGGDRFLVDLLNPSNGGKNANARAYTPLHWTAHFGNIEVIPVLVKAGADVNAEMNDGWTPLHTAAWFDKSKVIRVLADNDADIEALTYNDWTPLHIAVIQKAKKAIPALIKVGADKTAKDKNGRTPLDLAKEIKDEIMKRKIVKLLDDTA